VPAGNRGACQWRIEPDRIADLPTQMVIIT